MINEAWETLRHNIDFDELFTLPISSEQQHIMMIGALLLSEQIKTYYPELLHKEALHLVIAGAEGLDMLNGGMFYRCLPSILPELNATKIHISLVGPEVTPIGTPRPTELKAEVGTNVTYSHQNTSLGQFITAGHRPDAVFLNSPGFELHNDSWFITDHGIETCCDLNIPIFGSSYGLDEADIDMLEAMAYGFNITDQHENLISSMLTSLAM